MKSDSELCALLATLFPPGIGLSATLSCPADATLWPEEEACAVAMVEKRRREFLHGRHCARQALAALGVAPVPLVKNADRSPQWPAGYTGSITHTGELAAAVAAPAELLRSVGLDIELAEPLDTATRALIVRADEDPADGAEAKLLFSIKEAIYKCLYPHVQTYIDFLEMAVQLDRAGSTYRAFAHTDKVPPELGADLQGRFTITDEYVASSAWLVGPADSRN